uniref:RNA-directed DNA polymerase, eukaryota, nucleotide-binding alpha-beta plait domain protein n=1 Tax=Tanacetum cinerariifolium TaxID=118510 RepID=A0A6L2KV92_TANCI|nr:RNA-directed DNA polymerase, eukaryota, nucleotide-binding alpha-beta plait domain protein [Tanacetum cinerariifolium]
MSGLAPLPHLRQEARGEIGASAERLRSDGEDSEKEETYGPQSTPRMVCNDYGTVVDVFTPFKKSKAGKRFAFVRFIKVKDLDRLVENLCTIWIGRFHIHVNVARFHRPLKPNSPTPREPNLGTSKNSFASVLKEGSLSPVKDFVNSEPARVLDDPCIKEHDFSLSLMCKVKTVSAIPNLPIILSNEGFDNINITYLGGMWVLFAMDSLESKDKLLNHTGVNSWFLTIKKAYNSFVCDERITWVSIEGLPIKAWTLNSFRKIASLWGEIVEWEDSDSFSLSNKPLCLKTKIDDSINVRCKINIQDHTGEQVQSLSSKLKERNLNGGVSSHHNKITCSSKNKAGGSILEVMDEIVKVRQTMGYNMEGLCNKTKKGWIKELCHKHRINFVGIQETKLESIDLFSIKSLWGNLNFDHAVSSSVSFSGGILCVWDARVFTKEHVSKSDYFVAIMGTWFPTSTKLLVISVYAPQEITKKGIYGIIFDLLLKGFDSFVETSWKSMNVLDSNGLVRMKKKLQLLKNSIRVWIKEAIVRSNKMKNNIHQILLEVDKIIDQGLDNDEPFVLYELLLWCKHKRNSAMIFKVDFEKAFDSVKWDYILDTLKAFGFGQKWCKWINGCFDTAMGSVLVNGSPTS